jgi:hypothetical protein
MLNFTRKIVFALALKPAPIRQVTGASRGLGLEFVTQLLSRTQVRFRVSAALSMLVSGPTIAWITLSAFYTSRGLW